MQPENDDELQRRLNTETSKLKWTELQRHYAGGNVVAVDDGLDLIAAQIAAICHTLDGATLATRNVSDFEGIRLALVNPWAA